MAAAGGAVVARFFIGRWEAVEEDDVVAWQAALADDELCCEWSSNINSPVQVAGVFCGDGRMTIILAMTTMVVENQGGEKWSPWCRCFFVFFVLVVDCVGGWRRPLGPRALSLGSCALSDKLAGLYDQCGNNPHTQVTIDCTSSDSV